MTGLDYGGVEVKSFEFVQGRGWDSDTGMKILGIAMTQL